MSFIEKALSLICNYALPLETALSSPLPSLAVGAFMDSCFSKAIIKPFCAVEDLSIDSAENSEFCSFNDFFTREPKAGLRPVDMDPNSLVSPCDAMLSVCSIGMDRVFQIKGISYSISDLLGTSEFDGEFLGGTFLLFRLRPCDYHRFIYFDKGKQLMQARIGKRYHSVHPASTSLLPVYRENVREFSILDTENFGKAIQVEIGAMFVGRITNHKACCSFERGDEKGYFEFGGSSVALMLKKGAVVLDGNVVFGGSEYFVKRGQKIGSKLPLSGL
ncbi:MAG: phosphatidylserine decarboxylase [Eubacteriaceae bacterium]|nr:phosphatidylserine decarboxylase [Eubacteriaceae bacterium]